MIVPPQMLSGIVEYYLKALYFLLIFVGSVIFTVVLSWVVTTQRARCTAPQTINWACNFFIHSRIPAHEQMAPVAWKATVLDHNILQGVFLQHW